MKKNYSKSLILVLILVMSIAIITGCSNNDPSVDSSVNKNGENDSNSNSVNSEENYDGKLVFDYSLELDYAKNFSVDYYKGGYKLIKISDGRQFLTVPEGMSTPTDLESGVVALQMPIENVLISSTPTMSLIDSIGKLDRVALTTTKLDSWYIDNVVEKMNSGEIKYIGEYKAPDYEMLTAEKPPFSVFSTMLSTVPEVAEKLVELNIPVLLDQATYEEHPMARVEWVKLYGALFDCEEEAKKVFDEQIAYIDSLDLSNASGKTASIFYVTSKGVLHARQAGDYMVKMLELAGGEYILSDLYPTETGTEKLEFEEFYSRAKDSDYIIYIWSLGGKPETLADFTAINELFADFKAVKEGNVWCTTPDYFQISDTLGYMIKDINEMLSLDDSSVDKLTYLFRLK